MSLLDDIHAETPSKRPKKCSVGALIVSLPEAESKDLVAALDDPAIPHTAISRALTKRGHDMHDKRVANHRNGDCACPR